MWFRSRLTATQPYDSVSVDFDAAVIVVANPTASAILIRVGAPDIPDVSNYDEIVPAGQNAAIPCNAREFGIAFNQPASIASAAATKSGLFLLASVKFQTYDEPVPAYGSASFLSLSTSDVLPLQAFAGGITYPVIDVGAWGGALIHVSPSAGTGQGVCQVDISSDLITFRAFATYAFWPNAPATITIPRVARYLRITLNPTGIAGEPAIGGYLSVRETLSEISQLTYTPSSQPIVKAFAVPALGTVTFTFVTVGLPSVSIASIITAGTPGNAGQEIIIEVAADLVNWRLATFREQGAFSGSTMYRAVSNLDLFMRISVLEISNHGPLNGNLYLSIPPAADLGYILNTIQKSLGDNQNPVNVNQDVYHELDSIRNWDTQIAGSVASIDTKETAGNASLTSIATNMVTETGNTGAIVSNTNAISASDASIDTKMTANNTKLDTLHTDLNTTIHADVNGAAGFLTTIAGAQTRAIALRTGNVAPGGAGVFFDVGAILPVGFYLELAIATFQFPFGFAIGGVSTNMLEMAYGGAGGPAVIFYSCGGAWNPGSGANLTPALIGPAVHLDGLRSGGLLIVAGNDHLWVRCGAQTPGNFWYELTLT